MAEVISESRIRVTPAMRGMFEPDALSLAHSEKVARHVRDVIVQEGGWISFARYMELIMFAPGLGYYSAGAAKIGVAGDFITAPEMTPLFGQCLATQIAQVLRVVGGDVLEFGAGSGKLACDVLRELKELGCEPRQYLILEPSADLRERQRTFLTDAIPEFIERIVWLDAMPKEFIGVMIANEVLDAMPVHLIAWHDDGVHERGVEIKNETFQWRDRPLPPGTLKDCATALNLAPGYVSEIHLAGEAFVRSMADALKRGVALLIDYGFSEHEYYHADRRGGTLMCHYRHRAHTDPFFLPGAQDVTAHVNFTAMLRAALEADLQASGYATQAQFLIGCGITDRLARVDAANASGYLPLANQAQRLLSPAEMGELFKVLALSRACDISLVGFSQSRIRSL